MKAEQPYPARIHVSDTEVLDVRLYARSDGQPEPDVVHQGDVYVYMGGTSVNGGATTYDYFKDPTRTDS